MSQRSIDRVATVLGALIALTLVHNVPVAEPLVRAPAARRPVLVASAIARELPDPED